MIVKAVVVVISVLSVNMGITVRPMTPSMSLSTNYLGVIECIEYFLLERCYLVCEHLHCINLEFTLFEIAHAKI